MLYNNKYRERTTKVILFIAAVFSILAAMTIFLFLFIKGIPAINKIGLINFISGRVWMPDGNDTYLSEISGQYGILTMIVGSVYATIGAVIIGGFLGYFSAVFLSRFCPKKLKGVLTQLINLLAGIPSVIYGFFGMKILLPVLGIFAPNGSGSGLLAVSIILCIMIMPTIVSLSKTSLDAVPNELYEGARALGDTHTQAVFSVVVPSAKSGIVASIILGIGRAVGETMAVVMLAGNNTIFPTSLFGSFRTMTANVVLEMGYAGELQLGALIATGCILFIFVLIINTLFHLIYNKQNRADNNKKTRIRIIPLRLKSLLKTRPVWYVKVKRLLCYTTAIISIMSLVFIVSFILFNGIPNLNLSLLTRDFEYGEVPTILPSIVATLMLVFLSMIIAIPIGVGSAIYLNEYAKRNNKLFKIIKRTIELLAGIPSIIYGLFGMMFFCIFLKLGTSILAGVLTVTIMIIPVISRSTEESLKSVPLCFREGSYALGAGKSRTIFKVVLPSALPGILASIILAVGRVISESAPLMFTMGASLKSLPRNGFYSSGTSLAVALYVLAGEGLHIKEAYATASVLILIVLTLNIISTILVNKLQKKFVGGKC